MGHYDPSADPGAGKTDLFVLVDGTQRFAKRGFVFKDGGTTVDLPLETSDRFLTLACTEGGNGPTGDDVLIGDAKFDMAGK